MAALCDGVPPLLSSFIDAFVDYAVSGLFLPAPDPSAAPTPTFLPSPSRLVAVGDLHGDFYKSLSALSLAGLVDPSTLRWSGGSSVAVQVGDLLDRGPHEIRLLYLVHRLRLEAPSSGGALHVLLGNHEVMNLVSDFRYVSRDALSEFEHWAFWYLAGRSFRSRCRGVAPPPNPFRGVPKQFPGVPRDYWPGIRARVAALRPDGGPITSRFLAANPAVVVVGDTVFVHGGLLESHVEYGLDRINREAREWMEGRSGRRPPPWFLRGSDAVVWLRRYSDDGREDCGRLASVLAGVVGVGRMVMGHTIQRDGISFACRDQAVRVDVGLSRGCGDGVPEVYEILSGREARVVTSRRAREWADERKGLAVLVGDVEVPRQVEVKA